MADWPYSTAAWQRLRAAKLAETPLCEPCSRLGRVVPAQHVDHIRSIASGGDAFPALDGLMSMCPACHSVKTAAVDRKGGSGIRFKGVGLDGLPIDPDHPFMAEGYTPSDP
jgi:5-methylcytosine-specific restriction protein A